MSVSNDYKYVFNREAVKIYDIDGTQVGSVADAKRLMQDTAERAPSDGGYLGTQIDWRIPLVQYGGPEIRPGFVIVDLNNVAYKVQEADPPGTYRGTWNLYCLSLRALGHTVVVRLPTNVTDAATRRSPTYPRPFPRSPAIQETGEEEILFQGVVTGLRRYYSIWVLSEPRIETGAVLVDERNYVYAYDRIDNRRRLDQWWRSSAIPTHEPYTLPTAVPPAARATKSSRTP